MHFSTLFAALGTASILTSAVAGPIRARALTAPEIVTGINTLTTKSQNLKGPAESVNLVNGPLVVIGLGPFPKIIAGFTDIVVTATQTVSQMQGAPNFVKSDQDSILEALITFVKVHNELLNTLIGKANIVDEVPFIGSPVAAALRQVESVVDTLAFGLIDACPNDATALTAEKESLDETITNAINRYSPII